MHLATIICQHHTDGLTDRHPHHCHNRLKRCAFWRVMQLEISAKS